MNSIENKLTQQTFFYVSLVNFQNILEIKYNAFRQRTENLVVWIQTIAHIKSNDKNNTNHHLLCTLKSVAYLLIRFFFPLIYVWYVKSSKQCCKVSLSYFFLTTYFFRAILDPQFKKRHRGFSFTSLFPHIHSLPSKNMLHQTGTLVTGDGPAVTLHGCPRSTGYIRAQPVVVLYIQRFGRMYHDSSILTVSHRLVSLQGLCVWLLHSTSNPISATTDLF